MEVYYKGKHIALWLKKGSNSISDNLKVCDLEQVTFECVCSVAQLCLTLCDPLNYSPPDSSVHGIFRARILEWVAISFPR